MADERMNPVDNEPGLGNEVQGRIFHVSCNGDNVSEIEIAALAAAQEFFGDGVLLEVVQDYQVCGLTPAEQAQYGKKYRADVRVRALSQG